MTDQQRGFIGDIFGSGKHLLVLINDILDLSKVEAGKMMLDLESVQVSVAVREQPVDHRGKRPPPRHIRLEIEVAEELGHPAPTRARSSRSSTTCSPTPSSSRSRAAR